MPRFYLHVCDGSDFCEDEEGVDVRDLTAARLIAIEGLRDILAGEIRAGVLRRAAFVEIERASSTCDDGSVLRRRAGAA